MDKRSAFDRQPAVDPSELEARILKTEAFLKAESERYAGPGLLVMATSLGAEDMVLTDLIAKNKLPIEIFTLDTGRLNEETLRVIGKIKDRYGLSVQVYFPESNDVEALTRSQGVHGFYESVDARKACCRARKVLPLKRALKDRQAWMTGLRRSQSPTRSDIGWQEWDNDHGLQKLNPLVEWSEAEVWAYIRAQGVPYNALHDRGFLSIGCAPCTRAVQEGEDARAGRWWWEHPETKECGLHLPQAQ